MTQVDVFVPCYKYGRFLQDCVRSVLAQHGVVVRVLIIDDCSPDETPDVAARLVAADSRVEYRRHSTNKGHIATYNEGLDWTEGDYALLLSADDALTPGALSRAAAVMNQHPNVGFAYGKRILIQGEARPTCVGYDKPGCCAEIMDGSRFLEMMCRADHNPVCTPTAVVRTSVQKAVGYYRPELPHTGDLEMWLRFAGYGSVAKLDSPQAYWRQHDANMRDRYQGPGDLLHHKAAYDSAFGVLSKRIDSYASWQTIADERLSGVAFWRAHDSFMEGKPKLCDEYLEIARRTFPQASESRSWARLRVKRALGPEVWRAIARIRGIVAGHGAGASTALRAEQDPKVIRWIA